VTKEITGRSKENISSHKTLRSKREGVEIYRNELRRAEPFRISMSFNRRKNLPTFYGIRRFTTAFTSGCHWSLSLARCLNVGCLRTVACVRSRWGRRVIPSTQRYYCSFTFTFPLRLLCGLSMFWNTFQCSQYLSLSNIFKIFKTTTCFGLIWPSLGVNTCF
jgi:hypothetical protein